MPVIDYYFGIGSPWSYIGLDPLLDLSQRFGVAIRPVLIPLIEENGAIYSRNRPEARRAYWFTDLRRWAEFRGKTLKLEGRGSLSDPTPAGFLVLGEIVDGGVWAELAKVLQAALWEKGLDIGDAAVRRSVLEAAGFDAARLEGRAAKSDIAAAWKANYAEAVERGVFGLPTFHFDNELYWGQDSLPFLERHLERSRVPA
ncbi:2-hydroxychromene-2-carboxylate isomerase [Rhizobium azooxidifex]|uniref:2-hydroxychromene-2-carboxylate isomerase n=2 Tax=Mycoplana azooxidifex TaxID=1636188 RepID=A0A7W6DBL8_9HYPH|nr:DsbA family protein [Mycoplana azooxidifex]MBB3977667.1 2-hydroxychromene-2-carboxylate isomerase [Mycoplana azooxidifex]